MPGNDTWIWPGFTATAPNPYQVWDTTYPAGRDLQATGWTCPGCGRGYSPSVAACWVCPQQVTATTVTTTVTMHPCPRPLEGGMCGCEEADPGPIETGR